MMYSEGALSGGASGWRKSPAFLGVDVATTVREPSGA